MRHLPKQQFQSTLLCLVSLTCFITPDVLAFGDDTGEPVSAFTLDNNFCSSGGDVVIQPGLYCDLYVSQNWGAFVDQDFFRVVVPPLQVLTVKLYPRSGHGQVNVLLYDTSNTLQDPCTNGPSEAFGQTTDGCSGQASAIGTFTGDVRIRISHLQLLGGFASTRYDMLVELSSAPQGVSYCGEMSANSVGCGAVMASYKVLADTHFTITGLPPENAGIIYYGNSFTDVTFGCGIRCVDGNIFRLPPSLSDSKGTVSRVDVLPPGSYAQYWYRDPGKICNSVTFNLSNALLVP